MTATVLGFDVSRDRMGWGVVDFATGEPIDCGTIDLAPKNGREKADGLDPRRPGRIDYAVQTLAGPMFSRVTMTYLESPYAGKSGQVTVELALAVGSAWQALGRRFGMVELLQPREWKRLANVPADPKAGRANLKGAALRHAVCEEIEGDAEDDFMLYVARTVRAMPVGGLKPWPMARALTLGFDPKGSQDAADAGLIAVAGRARGAELFAMAA